MSESFENSKWGTSEDEANIVEGVVADSLVATKELSYSKQIDHTTGRVQTALEMIGRPSSREQARILSVRAMERLRQKPE